MTSTPAEREPIQARGYTITTTHNAPTELARIVAAREGWTIGHDNGDIFDPNYAVPIADSIEHVALALERLGAFAGSRNDGYMGIIWTKITPHIADDVRTTIAANDWT